MMADVRAQISGLNEEDTFKRRATNLAGEGIDALGNVFRSGVKTTKGKGGIKATPDDSPATTAGVGNDTLPETKAGLASSQEDFA